MTYRELAEKIADLSDETKELPVQMRFKNKRELSSAIDLEGESEFYNAPVIVCVKTTKQPHDGGD